jgi:hypothetical protein
MLKHYVLAATFLLTNFSLDFVPIPNRGAAYAQSAKKKPLKKKRKPKAGSKKRTTTTATEESTESSTSASTSSFYLQGSGSYVSSEVHEMDTSGFQGTFLASYRTSAMFGLGVGLTYLSLSMSEELYDVNVSSMATVLEINYRFPLTAMFAVEPLIQLNYGVSNQLEYAYAEEISPEPVVDLTGLYWGGLGLRLGAQFTPNIEGIFELLYLAGASSIYREGTDELGFYTEESTKKMSGFAVGGGIALHF